MKTRQLLQLFLVVPLLLLASIILLYESFHYNYFDLFLLFLIVMWFTDKKIFETATTLFVRTMFKDEWCCLTKVHLTSLVTLGVLAYTFEAPPIFIFFVIIWTIVSCVRFASARLAPIVLG